MGPRQLILKACRKHPRLQELERSPALLQAVEDMMRDRYVILEAIREAEFNKEAISCFCHVLTFKDLPLPDLMLRFGIDEDQARLLKESVHD